jgi:hypothetical protein
MPLRPPAAPTGATYHDDQTLDPAPVAVGWHEGSPGGVSIWVYAVIECLAPVGSSDVACVTGRSEIPASALVLLRKVPAAAGMTAWTWPGSNSELGINALGMYDSVKYQAIILRAVNEAGQSAFVVAGTTTSCYDCTY